MTELAPYLGTAVHVDAGDICADGELTLDGDRLRLTGPLGRVLLDLPIGELQWTQGPEGVEGAADLALEFGRPWMVHVWRRRAELPCLDFTLPI